ncbi:MAG TPA: single-stranded-DNA-specific exonuclease RecJ [Syntrophales bacterium]|nr:single-stranded-DNA-specific exonuclease RecJ [Syntrophales bacterium]HNS53173.1 single-stranded-DNA-specific exonuclease RecJ [Syntrophales bacterium]
MLPTTRWKLSEVKENIRALFAEEFKLNPIVSQILVNRSITDLETARRFLNPSLHDLHSPFLMKDMKEGVARLIRAVQGGEKVAIYGDYDADGITSLAILYRFLREIHECVLYYIPDRVDEGYSLNRKAIDRLRAQDVRLIVTVDCGVSDREEIEYARTQGIDTIVLDHHEVPATLPAAAAVINPNRGDCPFPFKHLAGVGIVFNFLIALRGALRNIGFWAQRPYPNLKDYLDLVALGTIGDLSPLVDENRIFARIGLELLNEDRRVGLKALRDTAGLGNTVIDSGVASFALIPRINAAGRVGAPDDAVRLLLTEDPVEAQRIASRLDACNRERQRLEKTIFDEIMARIDSMGDAREKGALVLASPEWHPGVIGIVASRVVDRFYRPTILISLKDGIGKGSGRSIAEFNLYEGLKLCDPLLISYGGHRYAAGISVKEGDIEKLSEVLGDIVKEGLVVQELVQETHIDAQCSLSRITYDLVSQFDRLAPFGIRNPEPILCSRNVQVSYPTVVGNKHLKMRVYGDGVSCSSIWFNRGDYAQDIEGVRLDIAFTPQINTWNGSSNIQLKVRDIAAASA